MTNYDVIKKLIGPIEPVGATHIDDKRCENIKEYVELYFQMTKELSCIARNKDRQEFSMKEIGKIAHDALLEVGEWVEWKRQ